MAKMREVTGNFNQQVKNLKDSNRANEISSLLPPQDQVWGTLVQMVHQDTSIAAPRLSGSRAATG